LSRLYLIDSNVYIRAFRETGFGAELRAFHHANLARLVVSAVTASELLVGAQTPDRERAVLRTLVEPFRTRRRLIVPSWSTWALAAKIDRGIRRLAANHTRLAQRSFMQDILIAASAREVGATIVTENTADFTLIARQVDIAFVPPWPPTTREA
jgi:predicted nucleic acid-binding protein